MTQEGNVVEIYQFHILLLGISPAIWRRVLVKSDTTISDFHYILQTVMGWEDEQAVETMGHKPEQVTTDGEQSYPKAIDKILGCSVEHRVNRYANNRLEQDHRGIKERYYLMLGFKSFESVARFCQAFEEQREYFGYRRLHKHKVSLPLQRVHILGKFQQLKEKFINRKLVWR